MCVKQGAAGRIRPIFQAGGGGVGGLGFRVWGGGLGLQCVG